MNEIKPFNKIPLLKYFQHDLEIIKMAYRLSGTLLSDLKNIRAAGNEVEIAVRQFYKEKLFPKFYVTDGHIVDSTLKVSPQFDIIISENSKNPVLYTLADKSELIYFETVFCFAEVKKSYYSKSLLSDFSENIKRLKLELFRETISPNYIESSNSGFHVEEPLTNLPLRNPIFSFLFFVNSSELNTSEIGSKLNSINNKELPNFIVLLDQGIIINVNKEHFENNKITINLYPEYEVEENIWVIMDLHSEDNVLTYQYMLVLEHLNNTVLSTPNIRTYTKNLFDFSYSNFHKL